jgi:hypothetical protein
MEAGLGPAQPLLVKDREALGLVLSADMCWEHEHGIAGIQQLSGLWTQAHRQLWSPTT